jgi:hypothetical protein
VIQGAILIDDEGVNQTQLLCHSIRKYFPDAVIVLSTWTSQDVSGIYADKVVTQEDPGSGIRYSNLNELNNINRQILSSKLGLLAAQTDFAIKVRSDLLFHSNAIERLMRFSPTTPKNNLRIFERYVIVADRLTMSPMKKNNPVFHVTDMIQAGLASDLLKLWSIPLMGHKDETFYLHQTQEVLEAVKYYIPRYRTEQYYWVELVKEYLDYSLPSTLTSNNELPFTTEELFNSNLIPFRLPTLGVSIQKKTYHWTARDSWVSSIYAQTFFDWFRVAKKLGVEYPLPIRDLFWEIRGELLGFLYRQGLDWAPTSKIQRNRETHSK